MYVFCCLSHTPLRVVTPQLDFLRLNFSELLFNSTDVLLLILFQFLLGNVGNPELPDLLWLQGYTLLLVSCRLVVELGKSGGVVVSSPSVLLVVLLNLLHRHVARQGNLFYSD